jgi:hypothetical protein
LALWLGGVPDEEITFPRLEHGHPGLGLLAGGVLMQTTSCPHCGGEIEVTLPSRRSRKPAAFWEITMDDAVPYLGAHGADLLPIPADICLSVLEWWNVARRNRHGRNAAWTQQAFKLSCRNLGRLPHWQQRLLIDEAVAAGWMKLDVSYVEKEIQRLTREQQQRQRSHGPQSSQLQAALSLIEGGLYGAD